MWIKMKIKMMKDNIQEIKIPQNYNIWIQSLVIWIINNK